MSERRFQYEAEVASNPLNYDAWFDYVRLEEAAGDPERVSQGCTSIMAAPTLRDADGLWDAWDPGQVISIMLAPTL